MVHGSDSIVGTTLGSRKLSKKFSLNNPVITMAFPSISNMISNNPKEFSITLNWKYFSTNVT